MGGYVLGITVDHIMKKYFSVIVQRHMLMAPRWV